MTNKPTPQTPTISPPQDDSLEMLNHLKRVFEKHNISYWLDCGILLKAIRDGHLKTSDVDITMWQSDINACLRACEDLRKDGFVIRYQNGLPYLESFLQIFIPPQYKTPYNQVDIEFYAQQGNDAVLRNNHRPMNFLGRKLFAFYRALVHRQEEAYSFKNKLYGYLPKPVQTAIQKLVFKLYILFGTSLWYVIPAHHFQTLSEIQIGSHSFPIPSDVEGYFAYRYGKNWKNRNPKWRLSDGDFLRIRPLRNLPSAQCPQIPVQSDIYSVKGLMQTDNQSTFHFTDDEIQKIKSLDT